MTTLEPIGNPVEWLAEQSIRMTTALRKISKVVQRAADNREYMSAIADIDEILRRLKCTPQTGSPLPFEDKP